MPSKYLHPPQFAITKTDARRFMLAHHHLWPPRQLNGLEGSMTFIQHVSSIQFDPINIVGRNPDLVLQSRVADYRPEHLDQLLYKERLLVDGWDKMASIYAAGDWPNFNFRRQFLRQNPDPRKPPDSLLTETLKEIKINGPSSSLDFKNYPKVDWHWGPTKGVRAAMEYLFSRGFLGVHHRINNRRYFDLIEKLLPASLLDSPDPFKTIDDYHDWHVLRRLGSLGLAQANSGEYWSGIIKVDAKKRQVILSRLIDRGKVLPISIVEEPDNIFFIRKTDHPALTKIQDQKSPESESALIAPLDNLMWNRNLIEQLYNFRYRWEVYKPKAKREYGYYVLPVIYGDTFIARLDPSFDKKKRILTIENWWWEPGVVPDEHMQTSLINCLNTFGQYLRAESIALSDKVFKKPTLDWMNKLDRIGRV